MPVALVLGLVVHGFRQGVAIGAPPGLDPSDGHPAPTPDGLLIYPLTVVSVDAPAPAPDGSDDFPQRGHGDDVGDALDTTGRYYDLPRFGGGLRG